MPDDTSPHTFQSLGNTQVDIVSREVIHLKLPKGVRPSTIKSVADEDLAKKDRRLASKDYVELYLATPNGISNRLLIPFKPKGAPADHPSESAYILLDDSLTIRATITPNADGKSFKPELLAFKAAEMIRIKPLSPPANDSETVDVEMIFPIDGDILIKSTTSGVPYRNGAYVIAREALEALAKDFLTKLNGYGRLAGDKSVSSLVSRSVSITVTGSNGASRTTYNPLRLSLSLFAQGPLPPVDASGRAPNTPLNPAPSTTPGAAPSTQTPGSAPGGAATPPPADRPSGISLPRQPREAVGRERADRALIRAGATPQMSRRQAPRRRPRSRRRSLPSRPFRLPRRVSPPSPVLPAGLCHLGERRRVRRRPRGPRPTPTIRPVARSCPG